MSLCRFCEDKFFQFVHWPRGELRQYHTDASAWAQSIKTCYICLTMVGAVKQAIVEKTGGDAIHFDPLIDLGIVHYFPLPLYKVLAFESVARDQWELEFKPIKEAELQAAMQKYVIQLPQRTFKVFATYYNSPRAFPDRIEVVERFRLYREKQERKKNDPTSVKPKTPAVKRVAVDSTSTNPTCIKPGITNSRICLEQAKLWLGGCNDHKQCKQLGKAGDEPFAPRRLLDLAGQEDTVKLVDTAHDQAAYCNHCWGGSVWPTLGKDNLNRFLESIAVTSLPLNFQDAIYAARQLGLRYLWIDSLCIVQDDPGDQQTQIPRMHDVYGRSYLNLAAANARDSKQGFFRYRDLSLMSATVMVGLVECKVIRKDFWAGNLLTEPLYRRAWVLQERTLSPRTLIFGRQAFWQCLETTACEIMPVGVPLVIDAGREELNWRRLLHQIEWSRQDQVNLQGVWRHLINTYKTCQITVQTDTLPALEGLVNKIMPISGQQYLAGLWLPKEGNGDLVSQLAWRVLTPNKRFAMYCAPTWAWAGVDGPIYLPPRLSDNSIYSVKILDKYVKIKKGKSAEVEEGWLTIEGHLLDVKLGKFHPDTADAELGTMMPLYYEEKDGTIQGYALALKQDGNSFRRNGLIDLRAVEQDVLEEAMKSQPEQTITII